MKIAVFGSASPKPEEHLYQESLALGKLLVEAGYDVLTGGYMGTMEAVSRGAAEAGGHVIGVTCREIEVWRPIRANAWVKEEWVSETLVDRLQLLTNECDGALALPGGIGTLVEICLTWNQMVVQSYRPKPLIVIGLGWQVTFETFFDYMGEYMPNAYRQWLKFAPDADNAVKTLKQMFNGSQPG